MNTVIYYFTGTGNSLKIAKDIASKLGNTKLVAIKDILGKELAPADRVGIVFPVFAWGPPAIVRRFVEQLKPCRFVFAVATKGGSIGATFKKLNGLLKRQGLKLDAGFSVKMPGNCITLYGPPSQEKQQKLFDAALRKVIEIARAIAAEKKGFEKGNFLLNIPLNIIYHLFNKNVEQGDRGFWADDQCIACALCTEICPVKNITLKNKKPVWLHHCEQCMACIQWCPKSAIQYQEKTLKRARYRHPAIGASDLI